MTKPEGFRNRVVNRSNLELEDYYYLDRLLGDKFYDVIRFEPTIEDIGDGYEGNEIAAMHAASDGEWVRYSDYLAALPAVSPTPTAPKCVLCGHNNLSVDGRCKESVAICPDGYHGTRECGCHCTFTDAPPPVVQYGGTDYATIVNALALLLRCDPSYIIPQVEMLLRRQEEAAQIFSTSTGNAAQPSPTTDARDEADKLLADWSRDNNTSLWEGADDLSNRIVAALSSKSPAPADYIAEVKRLRDEWQKLADEWEARGNRQTEAESAISDFDERDHCLAKRDAADEIIAALQSLPPAPLQEKQK